MLIRILGVIKLSDVVSWLSGSVERVGYAKGHIASVEGIDVPALHFVYRDCTLSPVPSLPQGGLSSEGSRETESYLQNLHTHYPASLRKSSSVIHTVHTVYTPFW